MNLVARQIYGLKKAIGWNTYIGGVSATISTAALLATKLGISVGAISNFTVVGADIKCKITGTYNNTTFFDGGTNNSAVTYFTDSDGLINNVGLVRNYPNLTSYYHPNGNIISNLDYGKLCPLLELAYFPNSTSMPNACMQYANGLEVVYIPRVLSLGSNGSDNACLYFDKYGVIFYVNPILMTANSGNLDGDLQWMVTNRSAKIVSVTNFTAPNPITTLSSGTIYNTAIQLNFTPPSSTNAIDFYDCYADGVLKNRISASGEYIVGLTASTSYNITVVAVDIFYNKSVVSNSVTQSTSNYSYTDTDANASIAAKSLTGSEQESEYLLITGLKTNSLYTKCQSIYTFKGTSSAQHKFNSKNPIDTDGAFRLTFGGSGNTYSNLGYSGSGTGYADSHFVPSVQQSVNNNGMTMVCGTNNAAYSADTVDVGSFNSVTQANLIGVKNNNSNYSKISRVNGNQVNYIGTNESRGILTVVKQSSTVTDMFWNSSQVATGNGGGTLPTYPIWIGCLNLMGATYGNSNQRFQMVIFHEGFSDAEVATIHSIINLSEIIAQRKNW